ncbi:MAG: SGNH/GDSL hydrolase family protein [Actinocrinis sp.]
MEEQTIAGAGGFETVGGIADDGGGAARSGVVPEGGLGAGALPVRMVRGGPKFTSFVALGDSFTEGMVDKRPDGSMRGWADLVAERLSRFDPAFRYANLAVRGRLVRQISDDQVPAALRMGADLVSLATGLNDVARPGCDLEAICDQLERCAATLVEAGATVVMFQSVDFTYRMPSLRRFVPRVQRLIDKVEGLRERYGVVVVDLSIERIFDDPRMWAPDRVHLATEGHRRIAEAVLEALGCEPAYDWRAPLPARRKPWVIVRMYANVIWTVRFLAPWIRRRMTGRSSGDGREAKRPELRPVDEGGGWAGQQQGRTA